METFVNKNVSVNASEQTIFSIKRMMGRSIDDPKVAEIRERYPYTICESDDPENRGVHVILNDTSYTPIDISAMILKQVIDGAEHVLNDKVSHAVITVPADFSEAQRAATRAAGEQAGLIVKKVIDEPSAAAIAFGLEQKATERNRVLVYDLGGGTFDISIIQMVNQQFQQLANQGDMWLGGDDFDRKIVDLIIEWVIKEHDFDPSEDKRFLMLAKQQAEKTKIALVGQDEVDLIIPAATRTPDGETLDVDMTVTRKQFERLIQPFVDHSMKLVGEALTEQNLNKDDITAVLMVGGSTAVPLVHQTVANFFGDKKVRRDVDPMQCVALGAAILAARLSGVECPKCQTENLEEAQSCKKCGTSLASARAVGSIGLGEVTAKSLGINAVGRDGQADSFAVIIPKGTQYPLIKPMESVFYTTSEHLIKVPVYEGEDPIASRNDLQGMIEYPLPQEIEPNTSVSISFNYDKDRVLKMGIRVHGRSDLEYETNLTRDQPPIPIPGTPEEEEDTWREDLNGVTNTAENFIEQYREYLPDGVAKKAENDVKKARRAYAENNKVEGQRVGEALHMVILGSGTATQLFLAERAMDGATPEQAEKLNRAMQELRKARLEKNPQREEKISQALEMGINQIFRERNSVQEVGEHADLDGLLRKF